MSNCFDYAKIANSYDYAIVLFNAYEKTLTSYYLATGRYYPLIAGNSRYYQRLAATTQYYLGNGGKLYLKNVRYRMLTIISFNFKKSPVS